jgi:hypothetical protein
MPYRLRMSAEIGDWIAELCSSAPGSPEAHTAIEVGAAVAAAMSATDVHDLALITDLAAQAGDSVDDTDLRVGVDYMYQQLLDQLERLRRRNAVKRWQATVDTFRARKEVAKARITAAEGARKAQLAFLAFAAADGDAAEIEQARADLATTEASLLAAKAQAVATLAEARRLLLGIGQALTAAGENAASSPDDSVPDDSVPDHRADALDDTADGPGVAAGLLELRADPLGAYISILCAVEPPGTLTLLAVLEGREAIDAHRHSAIGLSRDLLAQMRSEISPPPESAAAKGPEASARGELTFADTASFLAWYFPESGGEVTRRAASLAAATTP